MKKFLMLLLCAAVLCVECAACDFSKPKTVTLTNDSGEVITSLAPSTTELVEQTEPKTTTAPATQKEIKKEAKRFKKLISALDTNKISKIRLMKYSPNRSKPMIYESEDKEVIEQWIASLKEMKTSADKYEVYFGSGYSITFYEIDGTEINIGYFLDNIILTSDGGKNVLIVIENYPQLMEGFLNLKKQLCTIENKLPSQ